MDDSKQRIPLPQHSMVQPMEHQLREVVNTLVLLFLISPLVTDSQLIEIEILRWQSVTVDTEAATIVFKNVRPVAF